MWIGTHLIISRGFALKLEGFSASENRAARVLRVTVSMSNGNLNWIEITKPSVFVLSSNRTWLIRISQGEDSRSACGALGQRPTNCIHIFSNLSWAPTRLDLWSPLIQGLLSESVNILLKSFAQFLPARNQNVLLISKIRFFPVKKGSKGKFVPQWPLTWYHVRDPACRKPSA